MFGEIEMKTFMANPQTVERKWYIVDATGLTLGRLASRVASVLTVKNKPTYTPHVDTGDYVIVINCKDLVLTGKKMTDKYYRHHSGFPGGLKEIQYKHLMETRPEFAFYQAVKGMMPKNNLGKDMLKKLKEDLLQEGITLNIKYFGETKDFICDGGENLGKLNKSQLLDLYNSSDFGMVASLTNISLVPYEMLATGLPIIEFKEGTFNYVYK